MACPNIGTIEINIKMALNAVMERDSQNPTPILDKEPKKEPEGSLIKNFFLSILCSLTTFSFSKQFYITIPHFY